MSELDRFRDFRRGAAPPSNDAKNRASARLACALAGASTHPRRRLVLLAAGMVVALVATASAFSTVRDFVLDRDAESSYCIDSALRPNVISFRATDGVLLHGALLGSGPRGIILYGGGGNFRGSLCDWLPFGRTLAERGYRVIAVDSRPVTHRDRRLSVPVALHLVRDVVGAENELVRRGVRRVLVGGGFVGGTAAMTAAALIPRSVLAGVVVLSSPRQFAGMDAEAAARRVTAPSFFGVGSRDSLVEDVRGLYSASASTRKELLLAPSSGNGTQLLDRSWAHTAGFRSKLLTFVDAAFSPRR
jgi:pimeloyl-ACP methyl ester carboxylesterase